MTNPIKTRKQIIKEKIEKFKKEFNEQTIFQTDNFEDMKGIRHPCYSHYGIAKAFENFLSQSLNSAIDETIEAMRVEKTEQFPYGKINKTRDLDKLRAEFKLMWLETGKNKALDQIELQRKQFEGEEK